MRRIWFDYIEDITNSSRGNPIKGSGDYIKIAVDQEDIAIDIWSCSNIVFVCLLDASCYTGNIRSIYISSKNHINLDLHVVGVDLTNIDSLIIDSPGLALKSNIKFDNLYLMMSGFAPKISLPDYVANNIYVFRTKNDEDVTLCNALTGVIMLPGCGEFALDPYYLTKDIQNPKTYKAKKSLDELLNILPNTEWICPVVSWFGTAMNVKDCKIIPGKDKKFEHSRLPNWKVNNIRHEEAYNITFDKFGEIAYGGTISDHSLISYLRLVQKKGLKISLYPFIQMDVEGKVWRGRLTGDSADIEDFYSLQYRPFILHYANLTKNYVDAFIIGSELVGLTKITDDYIVYPFVDKLIELASEVKEILGNKVKIIYAADWSEYHTSDGIHRPLDKLWSSDSLDIIGIDAYFPVNDSTNQRFTREDVCKGWQSLQGWDYYYEDGEKKFYNSSEKWNCWKNLKYWWENEHWVGKEKTSWKPKMKPIWFTEVGFPSVDHAPNQPNVFYDHASTESAFPKHSTGKVDFAAQKTSLLGTIDFFNSQNYIENFFVWCWDARGVSWGYDNYYADHLNYETGHWIDGKVGYTGAITILPTKQTNLYIKSFTDVDIIPSLIITDRLEIFTDKALKIRDDLVIPHFHLLSSKMISCFREYNITNNRRDKILSKFNKKSEVIAYKALFIFKNYIIKTLINTLNDSENIDYECLISDYTKFTDFSNSKFTDFSSNCQHFSKIINIMKNLIDIDDAQTFIMPNDHNSHNNIELIGQLLSDINKIVEEL